MTVEEFMPIFIVKRDKLGRYIKGNNGQLGAIRDESVRKKLKDIGFKKGHRSWNKGRKQPQKVVNAVIKANKYRIWTPEMRKKLSKSHIGRPSWCKGLTKETDVRVQRMAWSKGLTKDTDIRIKKLADKKKIYSQLEENKQRQRIVRSKQKIPFRDSKPERTMQSILTLNGVKFEKHKMILDGRGFFHQVDIFIEPNFCIEIDGNYWHNLPNVIKRDAEVNYKLNQMGYQVIRVWEKDIKKNIIDCFELLKTMINNNKSIKPFDSQ